MISFVSFFLSWTLILSIKTFIEKPPDFLTKSSAPNFKPSSSSISSSFDVKKITGKEVFFLNFKGVLHHPFWAF